jgi:hypothetical protein
MSQVLPPLLFQPAPRSQPNSAPSPDSRGATALAWQREMERAQMTQWFHATSTPVVASPPPRLTEGLVQAPKPAESGVLTGTEKIKEPTSHGLSVGSASSKVHPLGSGDGSTPHGQGSSQSLPAGRTGFQQTQSTTLVATEQKGGEIALAGSAVPRAAAAPVSGAMQLEKFVLSQVTLEPEVRASWAQKTPVGSIALRAQASAIESSGLTASSPEIVDPDASPSSRSEAIQHAVKPALTASSVLLEATGLAGVRCHAQWTADGVNVWLGMDASVQDPTQQLKSILWQLQQSLSQQGQVLASVVCNGRTVFQRDSPVSLQGSNAACSLALKSDDMPSFSLGTYNTLFQQE